MEVVTSKAEIVKPANSSPPPRASIDLNSIDQISPRIYISYLLFFTRFDVPSGQLKRSLSKTLALFYPLAGRYKLLPNRALEIQCCGSGVEFFEATASKSLDEEIGSFYEFDPRLMDSLASRETFPTQGIAELPLVSIKLTRFLCGGACLQVATHHSAADGVTTGDFVKAWALISSGQEHLVHPPHLDPSLLLRADRIPPESTPAEFQIEPPPFADYSSKAERAILSFTNSGIRSLIQSGIAATRFEILAAHLWIAVTRARAELSALQPHEETKLGFAVDGRKRFNPPLPDGIFGNAVFVATTSSTVERLLAGSIDGAVNLIQEAKRKITHQHMLSTLAWLALRKFPLEISYCFQRSDLVISSWQRLGMMAGADFGSGKPVFAGSNGILWPGAAIIFPEIEENNRLVVNMMLERDQLHVLRRDPTLRV